MKLHNKKTGEIIDFEESNSYFLYDCGDKIILGKNSEEPVYGYTTLKEFNEEWEDYKPEEWEDYKPEEPLIKDEKIRKAVRAWANLYDHSSIRIHIGEDFVSLFKDGVNNYSSSVEIDLPPDVFTKLIDEHYYTIAKLCGEEE